MVRQALDLGAAAYLVKSDYTPEQIRDKVMSRLSTAGNRKMREANDPLGFTAGFKMSVTRCSRPPSETTRAICGLV